VTWSDLNIMLPRTTWRFPFMSTKILINTFLSI
jgi:hypothetical protein